MTAGLEPLDSIVMDQVTCKGIECWNVHSTVIANSFVISGGVTFQDSSDVVLTQTTIANAPANAVSFLPGMSRWITLNQLTIRQAVGSGIVGGGHHGAIANNVIANHQLYGIDAEPSLQSNLVTANRVSGNGTAAVRGLTDPSHVIANNIGF
ncbi:right-handed parallel beta-helix repeat-containing protein [Paenibacillus hodogayensis]|uniref:Right-handed parallel beta-helix repeat-containing protein n=1 Tax=Paenibacillus hodogayensis TaxID=279208 RepID=A0ABV5W7G9_9BACL